MTTTPKRSNDQPKPLKLSEIAALVGGELVGDGRLEITGVAGIKEAQKGDITFLANARYLPFLSQTQASAVIAPMEIKDPKKPLILSENPSLAFTKVVSHFTVSPPEETEGVHPTAVIGKDVSIGKKVSIGAFCVVEDGAVIGDGCVLRPQVFVGRQARLGKQCRLSPQVVLRERVTLGDRVLVHPGAVIGGDGFGYETDGTRHIKIPQTGSVTIGDDVEIGSNACIDRGRFQDTRIGRGTKIDNLVQIAHNVVIGEDCLIVSQVGVSGSTELGKNVIVAGQAGLVGHIEIGEGAVIGARAGVSKSVPAGAVVLGEPARPIAEQKRLFALIARLPELFKEFAELKKRLP
jgi:UDP-3-O-[3-hydroxymyristoyl] glucosamine N-acyltransferase